NANGFFLPETMPLDGPAGLPADLVAEYRQRFLHDPAGAVVSARLAQCCAYDWHLEASTRRPDPASGGCSWISHLASSGAEVAVHAWWRYRYTGDEVWLRSHAYPLLRGTVEFYRSLARRGGDGLWHLHGTNAHEDFWGVTDSIMDLAAIRGTLPPAIRAAEMLGEDADLREAWGEFLDQLAPYPMGGDPRAEALAGGALAADAWAAGYKDKVDGSHNSEDVQLTPIFPFEDWTLETDDAAMDAVALRTLCLAPRHRRVLSGETLPTAIRSPIAAVRAGQGEALPGILERYRAAFSPLPNGFSLFEQITPGYQAHSIEHLGLLAMILQEALLQSVSPRPGAPEVISVFPAWPGAWDAEFRLLARGGFMVTASIRDGDVQFVEIESRLGGICRFRNCWRGSCGLSEGAGPRRQLNGHLVTFGTNPGKTYRVEAWRE
ncbi:MAG: glycoside hydrolase family 95-like protein, partial [bacterium]